MITLFILRKSLSSFTYLGAIESNDTKMDKEIEYWIGQATPTFGNLYPKIWNRYDVSLTVKSVQVISMDITTIWGRILASVPATYQSTYV